MDYNFFAFKRGATVAVNGDTSILTSIKKLLGIDESYDHFDMDITIHINSAFATLQQLAVGTPEAFSIQDNSAKWSDFIKDDANLNPVITYIYIRVRLLFDPPETSYARDALFKQSEEIAWRLNVYSEQVSNPPAPLSLTNPTPVDVPVAEEPTTYFTGV